MRVGGELKQVAISKEIDSYVMAAGGKPDFNSSLTRMLLIDAFLSPEFDDMHCRLTEEGKKLLKGYP